MPIRNGKGARTAETDTTEKILKDGRKNGGTAPERTDEEQNRTE
jgi:hypothetical protein